ncbi:probable calcium-binding protein CML35 [Zingiber officinale]|uniref:probable calcium-binding protein CML35 n=1 Tax=Zingiber officinale TaxID=94328 RepID=UPI001C4B8F6A|nr:probable calcium-binding protein CML35 [Zingiber officinale]
MAFKSSSYAGGKTMDEDDVTVEEFKEWLRRFDVDKDGRISSEELRRAIASIRGRLKGWIKGRRGIKYADANGDGFIGEDEIDKLIEFAGKKLDLRIVFN